MGFTAQTTLYIGTWASLEADIKVQLKQTLCLSKNQDLAVPCHFCRACLGFEEGQHPECLILGPTPEVQTISPIKMEEIRQILEFVSLPPIFQAKIVLLIDAERLTLQAANALLKILEEPRPQVYFTLTSNYPHLLPLTILSRCIKYNKRQKPDPVDLQKEADMVLNFSSNLEFALKLTQDKTLNLIEFLNRLINLWQGLIKFAATAQASRITLPMEAMYKPLLARYQNHLFVIWDGLHEIHEEALKGRSLSKPYLFRKIIVLLLKGLNIEKS